MFMEEWIILNEFKNINDTCNQKLYNITKDNSIINLSNLFKVIGDYTRIKILHCILEDELCVYDIAEVVKMNQSAVSHQLKILRENRLVKTRKSGKQVYYSLNDDHIKVIFEIGLKHVEEENDLDVWMLW